MTTPHALRERHRGAPESLRRAVRRALADPAVPRVTRRELLRLLDAGDPPLHGAGVVPFPAVLPGGGDGNVWRAVASEGPRADLTPVPAALAARVRAWLAATLPDVATDGLRLHVTGPAPGDGWEGRSCELALAAAAVSRALGVPPAPVVVTGALGEPGRLVAVGEVQAKATLVADDLPDHRLVHPGDADAVTAFDEILPGWAAARAGHAGAALRRARAALQAVADHDTETALREAEAALRTGRDDPAVVGRAAWARATALLHAGRAEEALASLDEATAALPAWTEHADDPPDDLVAEEVLAWTLVALVDAGRVRAALTRGLAALETLRGVRRRTRRWRWVTLQLAGSMHRAALAVGEPERAAALLREVCLGEAVLADQRARCLGDLAEVARRTGDVAAARRLLAEARRALPEAHDPQGVTARFLELFEGRLDPASAPPPRPAPLWPELGLRLLATRRGTEDLAALHALPAVRSSVPLQWVVATEAVWHALHGGPGAAVLDAAREDVARWQVDDPGLAALLARVAAAPRTEDLEAFVRRSPYG